MNTLQSAARRLLETGDARIIIGYQAGSAPTRRRPCFIRQPADTNHLLFDPHCRQNLAVYLLKPEIQALGRPAILANATTLRTILQYAVENQLRDGAVTALATGDHDSLASLTDFAAVETYLATHHPAPAALDDLLRLDALDRTQRREYWAAQLDRCIRCYACRAACPLCYCTRCISDHNQPQSLPVASTPLGNLEWNVIRAMHLAGRCIECGSCAAACPQEIRIDLLNAALAAETRTRFAAEPGFSLRREYALSTWKPDDKEDFIR